MFVEFVLSRFTIHEIVSIIRSDMLNKENKFTELGTFQPDISTFIRLEDYKFRYHKFIYLLKYFGSFCEVCYLNGKKFNAKYGQGIHPVNEPGFN